MAATRARDGLLLAGTGRALITPPAGFAIYSPEFGPRPSTGIDDDLLAKVLLFEAEGRRAALCTLDVWGISAQLCSDIANAVASAVKTYSSLVWVTCTGNGASPPLWEGASADRRYGPYMSYLTDLCGGAGVQARESLGRGAIGVSSTALTDVTTGAGGKGHEADSAVNIASVVDQESGPVAQLLSFSCPAIIRGDEGRWTSDFPGYASWALERAGSGLVMFARGSDADVMPYDWYDGNDSPSHREREAVDVQALGLLLATQVAAATRQVETRRNVSIETAADDEKGIHVLRTGPLVCISVARPQPAVFARHLRRAMPRSTAIVSTNVSGLPPGQGRELDVDLELTTLEVARAAGAR